MMRRARQNAKFALLAREIGQMLAVGLLESLWHFTAETRHHGDVGRELTDEQLEQLLQWPGEAGAMVPTLVRHKWLDRVDGAARLIVHDWSEHADDAVQLRVARAREWFADGRSPSLRRLPKKDRAPLEAWYASHSPGDPDGSSDTKPAPNSESSAPNRTEAHSSAQKHTNAHAVHTPCAQTERKESHSPLCARRVHLCALPEPEPEPEPVTMSRAREPNGAPTARDSTATRAPRKRSRRGHSKGSHPGHVELSDLTVDELREALIDRIVRSPDQTWSDTEADRQALRTLMEDALSRGRDAPALFAANVTEGRRYGTEAADAAAQRRKLVSQRGGETVPAVARLFAPSVGRSGKRVQLDQVPDELQVLERWKQAQGGAG